MRAVAVVSIVVLSIGLGGVAIGYATNSVDKVFGEGSLDAAQAEMAAAAAHAEMKAAAAKAEIAAAAQAETIAAIVPTAGMNDCTKYPDDPTCVTLAAILSALDTLHKDISALADAVKASPDVAKLDPSADLRPVVDQLAKLVEGVNKVSRTVGDLERPLGALDDVRESLRGIATSERHLDDLRQIGDLLKPLERIGALVDSLTQVESSLRHLDSLSFGLKSLGEIRQAIEAVDRQLAQIVEHSPRADDPAAARADKPCSTLKSFAAESDRELRQLAPDSTEAARNLGLTASATYRVLDRQAIFFDPGSKEMSPAAKWQLALILETARLTRAALSIRGDSDRQSDKESLALALDRARAVAARIAEFGAEKRDRIPIVGMSWSETAGRVPEPYRRTVRVELLQRCEQP
jgi:outer membrane protein OmpA-like peptidoglycan-associated protein